MKQQNKKKILMISVSVIIIAIFIVGMAGLQKNEKKDVIISDVSEIDGQVIAMLDGNSYDYDIQKIFPNATLKYYPSYVECMTAVKSGKAAAYITEEPIAVSHTEETVGLSFFSEPLLVEKYAYMMGKDNITLQKNINYILDKFESNGVLDELKKEWIYGEGTPSVDRNPNADTSNGTLKVITSSDVKPFCYVENGEIVGYEVELLVKVAEELGYAVDIKLADFSAFMPAIMEGKMDIAMGCISITPEREEAVGFSNIECASSVVAVVANGEREEGTLIDQLKESFDATFVKEGRWKLLKNGLLITIKMSIISLIFGSLLGLAFSFLLRSEDVVIRGISNAISTFLDGMPLVILLMVLYYIVFKSVDISAVWICVIGFTIDFANVVAGLLNTGIAAVDEGQLEAAASMGYNRFQIFWKITFPQAAKYMLSQYEGAVVGLVKGTSIAGYITVGDLTKAGDMIRSRTYQAFFPLVVTAVVYFLIAYLIVAMLKRVDIKLDPKRRPRKIKGVVTSDNDKEFK